MSTLVSILRAVHCRSTHHYFAIDALERIDTPHGRRLASVLLANYADYLSGAKAPDTKFKDFQNHVVHVSDNNWGGAPKACEAWLARVIKHMHEEQWNSAAYAIGVLSHYFTDPLMPLHTAQHPSEAVVHRPLEWSVCKAYESIFRKCTGQVQFSLDCDAGWISKAVLVAAAIAHPHYRQLIDLYDLKKGVQDPPKGLNLESRLILAELFDYALTGWARILERIAVDALIEIPIYTLTYPTVMAAVDMPVAWIVSRVSDVREQRAVKAIFEEFNATGAVVHNLPAEIRCVAMAKPPLRAPTFNVHRLEGDTPVPELQEIAATATRLRAGSEAHNETRVDNYAPTSQAADFPVLVEPVQRKVPTRSVIQATEPIVNESNFSEPEAGLKLNTTHVNLIAPVVAPASREPGIDRDSDIVDAPSIGPKTAARFYKIGIATIGQFLDASSAELASLLKVNWITEQLLIDWQDQARLVIDVAALCGYRAQLLIGVNCRCAKQLAAQNAVRLHGQILAYSLTTEGARILRSAAVPSCEEIEQWIQSSQPRAHRSDLQPLVYSPTPVTEKPIYPE